MVGRAAERYGVRCLGLGTDLCQEQPDRVLAWMRNGRWNRADGAEEDTAGFRPQPAWFRDNRDFGIARGLRAVGFDEDEVAAIMGGNWLDFFDRSFGQEGLLATSEGPAKAAAGVADGGR